MKLKTLKIGRNKKGKRIALTWSPEPRDAYSVYVESTNYSCGLYVKSWGYVKRGLIFADAEKLFNKRIAGRK